MIEQQATVLEVRDDSILIRTQRQSGCQSCDVKSGCGTSVIERFFPERPQQQLILPIDQLESTPKPGDQVVIGINESYLQNTTMVLYLVPLMGLLLGAVVGSYIGTLPESPLSSEPMSILLCLLGLSLGLWIIRQTTERRHRRLYQAVKVLRIARKSPVIGVQELVASARPDST